MDKFSTLVFSKKINTNSRGSYPIVTITGESDDVTGFFKLVFIDSNICVGKFIPGNVRSQSKILVEGKKNVESLTVYLLRNFPDKSLDAGNHLVESTLKFFDGLNSFQWNVPVQISFDFYISTYIKETAMPLWKGFSNKNF